MYPPLAISDNLIISDIPDTNPMKRYLVAMADGDDALLTEISTCGSFGTSHYDGSYKRFSDMVYSCWKMLYKWATGYKPDRDVFNKANRATVLDSLVGMVMCTRWARFKKAYRFDPELELSLASVDEVKVPVSMLDRLPYNSFYVEFAEDGIFAPQFHGTFVEIVRYDGKFILKLMRLTPDLRTMSGIGTFHIDDTKEEQYFYVSREDVDGKHESDPNGLRNDWEEFCFFILNAILYLCAANADIRESSETKDTYKPGKESKPGYSGLQKFECGYVYGETVRLHQKNPSTEKRGYNTSGKERKPVRPHPVRASWQHYWKGHGENKERVLIFKEPYYVGGKADYVTISKVE